MGGSVGGGGEGLGISRNSYSFFCSYAFVQKSFRTARVGISFLSFLVARRYDEAPRSVAAVFPGNERVDKLAGEAAKKIGPYTAMSLAHLKLRISERFWKAKEAWHDRPDHHGTEEIPPPPPKKPMLDKARNAWRLRSGQGTGAQQCTYTGFANAPTTSAGFARTRSK